MAYPAAEHQVNARSPEVLSRILSDRAVKCTEDVVMTVNLLDAYVGLVNPGKVSQHVLVNLLPPSSPLLNLYHQQTNPH
jgi:hypothetical protein